MRRKSHFDKVLLALSHNLVVVVVKGLKEDQRGNVLKYVS